MRILQSLETKSNQNIKRNMEQISLSKYQMYSDPYPRGGLAS